MRQAGTWDPLLQCCNACPWTHLSSSNKIQRNCMGLKITVCMLGQHCMLGQLCACWGKFWTKDKKRPKNPTAPFEEPGAKAGGQEQKQGTAHAPCTKHHLRGEKNTQATPPARPRDTPLPSPHIRNKLAPASGSEQAR